MPLRIDLVHREIAQRFVKLGEALEKHLPQFRMAADDLLNAGNVMNCGRSDHASLSIAQ